jgi:YVTN family beta-propeller protein
MKNRSILFVLAAFLLISSCDNSNNSDPGQLQKPSVYIVSEGNFTQSNGAISSYNFSTGESTVDVIADKTGSPFVGYIQGSTIIDNELYVVTNSPSQIRVYDLETFNLLDTAELSFDARAISPAGNDRGYVSSLNDSSVVELNLESMQITDKKIAVGPYPNYTLNADGKVYVSNGNSTVSMIDVSSGALEKNIPVGPGPNQIIEGPSGFIWVVSEGYAAYDENGNRDPENDTPGGIYIIDPARQTVVDKIEIGGRPTGIAVDENSDLAYVSYTSSDVVTIDMNTQQIVDESFINRSFNAIGFTASEQMILGGVSNGYTQNGKTIVYTLDGTAVDSFEVGKSPIEFEFIAN